MDQFTCDVDVIVVGAGLAGCVIAERAASQLGQKVLVVEQRSHLGGNCYDYKDQHGQLIHKYGPHLFHTNHEGVWNYLSGFTQWHPYVHRVLAHVEGKTLPIPFNMNSVKEVFDADTAKLIETALIDTYGLGSKVPILELRQSKQKQLVALADYVYENIFVNYTSKQWGLKPDEIDVSVTARVPVFTGYNNNYFHDKYQAVPKDGYTAMITKMLSHPNITVQYDTDFLQHCHLNNGTISCFGNPFFGKVVYTGKLDELFGYHFGKLPYRSLDMAFETLKKPFFQDTATVNYPNDYDFTRITEFKHIHPITSDFTTVLREYPTEHVAGENTPYYPIFTDGNQQRYVRYKRYAQRYRNLILLGRLAEYKYYDMDDIVARALEQFQTHFLDDVNAKGA